MHNTTFFTFLHHFGVKIELYGLFDYAFFVIAAKKPSLAKNVGYNVDRAVDFVRRTKRRKS